MSVETRRSRAYLSIDFDYWECTFNNPDFIERCLVANKGAIAVVPSHEMLVPFVEACNASILINVDYHADISDIELSDQRPFNDGTWSNFIAWRHRGHYAWYMPCRECYDPGYGLCDSKYDPFGKITRKYCGWKSTSKHIGLPCIGDFHIVGLGFAVSPDYVCCSKVVANARPLISRNFISMRDLENMYQHYTILPHCP